MGSLAFLAIGLGVFCLGATIVWFRNRERRVPDTSIDDFQSGISALGPMLQNRGPSPRWSDPGFGDGKPTQR